MKIMTQCCRKSGTEALNIFRSFNISVRKTASVAKSYVQLHPLATLGIINAFGFFVVGVMIVIPSTGGQQYALYRFLAEINPGLTDYLGLLMVVAASVAISGFLSQCPGAVRVGSYTLALIWSMTAFIYLVAGLYGFFISVGWVNTLLTVYIAFQWHSQYRMALSGEDQEI
jgi:hypothetical protein